MIHLKSIEGVFPERKFALLLIPDLSGEVHNNKELYQRIFPREKVTIAHLPLTGKPGPVEEIDSQEFIKTWEGD